MRQNSNRWGFLSKKVFIILASVITVLLITLIVVVIIVNSGPKYEVTGGDYDLKYHTTEGYSEMLDLYSNLPNEMSEDYFYEILDKGGISREYVQIFPDAAVGYVAKTPVTPDMDFSNSDIELISFRYLPGDDESTVSSIDDVTFHSYRNGRHDFIRGSSENEYIHSSDNFTNTYDRRFHAIDSYLMTL